MSEFRVRTTVLPDGERQATLIGRDGLPVFLAAVYSVSELRGRNLAHATINNSLRALAVLELFLESCGDGLSLLSRMDAGILLSLPEIEGLSAACRASMDSIQAQQPRGVGGGCRSTALDPSTRAFRKPPAKAFVSSAVAGTRLQVIRDYLGWLVRLKCSMPNTAPKIRESLSISAQIALDAISARMPRSNITNTRREGLGEEATAALLDIVDPESKNNPWQDDHTRIRNALIVKWLYYLGLRRGELLNVLVSDIDFSKQTVSIVRRPDYLKDPRRYKPNVKTRGRQIPLSPLLLDQTRDYIIRKRGRSKLAKKHSYLFVANNGAPLSLSAFTKTFKALKGANVDLHSALTSHTLRHTWNDEFSAQMDDQHVNEDTERKLRAYLMGWAPTSEMPATYTKRHVRKKAQKASIALQNSLITGPKK